MPVLEEYLYSIGAVVDTKSFKVAQAKANQFLKSTSKKWEQYQKSVAKGDKKKSGELLKNMNGLEKKFGETTMKMLKVAPQLAAAFLAVNLVLKTIKKTLKGVYDITSKISNQFVSMKSMFVDKDIRNLMAITGVGAVEAQAIRSAEQLTGMGIQELPYATIAEQKLFSDLIQRYTDTINSMDPRALEKYNDTVQNFQKVITEAKLDMQLAFMEMIISAGPELEVLFDTLTRTTKNFIKLVQSPAFKTATKLFVEALNIVVVELTRTFNMISDIVGFFKGSSNTATTTTNTTNMRIDVNSNAKFQGNLGDNNDMLTNFAKNNGYYIAQNIKGLIG